MQDLSNLSRTDIMRVKLRLLQQEHRDLDDAIKALEGGVRPDMFTIRRLKKQKLILKDKISLIEDQLLPDIIA